MALTRRQAFKVAFLQRCADEGLSIDETLLLAEQANAAIEKAAGVKQAGPVMDAVGKLSDLAMWGGDKILSYGLPAALIAPPVLGALGGYGAAELTGGSDESPEDIKTQEKADAYQRAAELARASTRQAHDNNNRRRRSRSLI